MKTSKVKLKKWENDTEKHWIKLSEKHLIGKTVELIRYLSDSEANELDWYSKPLVIQFTDGSIIFASKDDEGNDGGALFTTFKGLDTIPVVGLSGNNGD